MTSAEVPRDRGPARHRGRSLNGLAVILCTGALSFILIALLVVTSSRAAFTATTADTGNSASTASLALTDDDSGSAMFTDVTGLVPGVVEERCIRVTYTGDVDPGPVRLYAAGTPTGGLAPHLDLAVDIGSDTGGPFSTCSGFTPTGSVYTGPLTGLPTGYATGLPTWDPAVAPAPGEVRTFRFRLQVRDEDAAQAKTSTFGFTWETRSA